MRLKICVSNSLYNILLSGSIVWATRPIFDAPQLIVWSSWSLKNSSALSGLPTFAYLCANQTVSRRAGVASMAWRFMIQQLDAPRQFDSCTVSYES